MGLTDAVFDYLRHRRFVKGAEVLGAAEALEKNDHPGIAARFYDRALEFFQSSAADNTFYQTVAARNRCRQRALDRGEDMSFAYGTSIEDIGADPPRFIAWYYASQHKTLSERLVRAYNSQDWPATARLAAGGKQFLQFAGDPGAVLADYDCCYFGGAALFKMGRYEDAHGPMQRAYMLARDLKLRDGAKAWTAYFLGLASYHVGARTPRCEESLQEAVERLGNLTDDPFAFGCSQEAAGALGEVYSHQFGSDYSSVIAAARRLLAWEGRHQVESATARAEACVAADDRLAQVARAIQDKRFDAAVSALRDAVPHAQAARSPSVLGRLEETTGELRLSDPRNLPEHSRAVDAFLAEDKFPEADQLRVQLHARHGEAMIVTRITEAIVSAKRAYVDREVARAGQRVDQKNVQEAEEALANAQHIGAQVGYVSLAFDSTQARLSQLKAIQMALEAQGLGKQREFKRARDLVRQAGQLPNLPQAVAGKLGALDAALARESDGASSQCRTELQDLMRREEWQKARESVDQAAQKGYDQAVAEEARLVAAYEENRDKLQKVSEARAKNKLATARGMLAEVQAATPSPAMRSQAAAAQADLDRLIDKVVRTYVRGALSDSLMGSLALAGLVSAGLLWWKSSLGFWVSLTVGLPAALAIWGLVLCVIRLSPLAHDDGSHGMTYLAGAGVTAVAPGFLEWYWAIALGVVVGLTVAWLLQQTCPAVSGVTLEPKDDQKKDDQKKDGEKKDE